MHASPPFAFFSATRGELEDLYHALMMHTIVTNAIREEQHQEPIDPPMILQKIELLMKMSAEKAHAEFHRAEDALWEYSWYTFTDEWAMHRARQDVLRAQKKSGVTLTAQELEQLVETQYEKEFETYSAEVDMTNAESVRTPVTKKRVAKKKS